MNAVIPFAFDSHAVRAMEVDGAPWFVASDVAASLDYRIAGDMTRMLDDDERGTQIVRTPSGDQDMLVINESGLFSAVLRSRKPEARRFRRWVTAEVLPALRRTGQYGQRDWAAEREQLQGWWRRSAPRPMPGCARRCMGNSISSASATPCPRRRWRVLWRWPRSPRRRGLIWNCSAGSSPRRAIAWIAGWR